MLITILQVLKQYNRVRVCNTCFFNTTAFQEITCQQITFHQHISNLYIDKNDFDLLFFLI